LWQTLFYITAVTYGTIVLKDTTFIPWFLGGSGSWEQMSAQLPFEPVPPGVNTFFTFELGYFVGSVIEHTFFEEKTNDFVMYMLHHVMSLMLLSSAFLSNFLGLGCIALYPIDMGDIFTASASGFGQTKYDILAAINFFTLMVVWIYTRLIIVTWICYKMWTDHDMHGDPRLEGLNHIMYYHCFMFGLLCVMNFIWFYMFTQIAKRYIVAGETEDTVGDLKKRQSAEK